MALTLETGMTQESDTNKSIPKLLVRALLDGEPKNSMLRKVALRLENAAGRPLLTSDVLGVDPHSIQALRGVGRQYVEYFQRLQEYLQNQLGESAAPNEEAKPFGAAPQLNLQESAAAMYAQILEMTGGDIKSDGMQKTPQRAADAALFFTQGYRSTVEETVGDALFEEESSGLVTVPNIEFYSLCEHHMLPFFGRCHVGYIPNGLIIGLSKMPRLVDLFARRYQVQERLTRQVAEAVQETLNPLGVVVVTEASHLCMMMRGVNKQHLRATSSCALGVLKDDTEARREFFDMIRSG